MVKISIFSGTAIIIAALINAIFFIDLLKIFTGKVLGAAMLLRMSYETTLIFIGYIILLFGFLRSIFSLLRTHSFNADSKKLQLQFIILSGFIVSFLIARAFVVLLDIPLNSAHQLWLKGYRIHHFFYGIGVLVDEFGLLLTFGDYWSAQSYVFFVIISLLFLITLLFEAYKLFNTSSSSLSKDSALQLHQ